MVCEHQQVLRKGESNKYPIQIDAVQIKQNHQQQSTPRKKVANLPLKAKKHCTRCGGDLHPWKSCPAKDATCHSCHRKRHYSSWCLTKKFFSVQAVELIVQAADLPTLNETFLDTVVTDSKKTLDNQSLGGFPVSDIQTGHALVQKGQQHV